MTTLDQLRQLADEALIEKVAVEALETINRTAADLHIYDIVNDALSRIRSLPQS